MPNTTNKSAFKSGLLDGAPFVVMVAPFGLLFGVIAADAGLNIFEVMGFSIAIIAGAAQFTAIELLRNEAPTFVVIFSALAVNLRMAMYSATLAPYLSQTPLPQRILMSYMLVDQSFALGLNKFETSPEMTRTQKYNYFLGASILMVITWFISTYLGGALGQKLPAQIPLDFALPIAFLALSAPMIRSLPHLAAAFIAILMSILCVSVPYSLGMIIAGFSGMCTGAACEAWLLKNKMAN